ncbi:MAG: hypothetical protein WCQ99_02315 [Pseudomonadota bacterium]
MTKEVIRLEQRYNRLIDEIRKLDEHKAAGRITGDSCFYYISYRQLCKARDKVFRQIQRRKTAISEHELKAGFAGLHGNQLAFPFSGP